MEIRDFSSRAGINRFGAPARVVVRPLAQGRWCAGPPRRASRAGHLRSLPACGSRHLPGHWERWTNLVRRTTIFWSGGPDHFLLIVGRKLVHRRAGLRPASTNTNRIGSKGCLRADFGRWSNLTRRSNSFWTGGPVHFPVIEGREVDPPRAGSPARDAATGYLRQQTRRL
jgi:hypothetical protein